MKACPQQSVALVDHGILKNFEMSRSPLVASRIRTGTAAARSARRGFAPGHLIVQKQQIPDERRSFAQIDRTD